jgi:putative endonuclease
MGMAAGYKLRRSWLERTLAALNAVARLRESPDERAEHLETGEEGEDKAFFYLRSKSYIVVARRWSSGDLHGDVDLIAWQGGTLCFVEVKTRTAHDATPAEAAVDTDKRRTLRRLARAYLRKLDREVAPPVRFDVLSVYLVAGEEPEYLHFEGAFGWNEEGERG